MEKQTEIKENIGKYWGIYRERMPDVAMAYDPLPEEVYKDGVIPGRTKRLMALCAALVKGCRGCMLYQTGLALEQGASVEEVLEACAVAVSLGGTMGSAETAHVVQYLSETGKL